MDITTLVDDYIMENGGEVSNDDLAYHFYALGKKDAINSVWHSADEIPQLCKPFLELYSNGTLRGMSTHYQDHLKVLGKWAYIEDILPIKE